MTPKDKNKNTTIFVILLSIGVITIIISLRNFGYLTLMSITSDVPIPVTATPLTSMDIFNIIEGIAITYLSYLGLRR